MDLTDDNLVTLSEYLKHTLSPDVNVRRPGQYNLQIHCLLLHQPSYVFHSLISDLYFSREVPRIGRNQSELPLIITTFSR